MKRGEIYWVDLGVGKGSEQYGHRPCLVIQNDRGNTFSPTTIVLPITKATKRFTETHVPVDGLREPSNILCEQIRTVDKTRFGRYITRLDDIKMAEVTAKMCLTFGM